ncbi:hypothetical protein WS68_19785 [Burkholderia sp. TSV86]|nr:hypothetical protein WS68_19785 [Burkholderia sp. TSV86]
MNERGRKFAVRSSQFAVRSSQFAVRSSQFARSIDHVPAAGMRIRHPLPRADCRATARVARMSV